MGIQKCAKKDVNYLKNWFVWDNILTRIKVGMADLFLKINELEMGLYEAKSYTA
jgi:hypothetical protein